MSQIDASSLSKLITTLSRAIFSRFVASTIASDAKVKQLESQISQLQNEVLSLSSKVNGLIGTNGLIGENGHVDEVMIDRLVSDTIDSMIGPQPLPPGSEFGESTLIGTNGLIGESGNIQLNNFSFGVDSATTYTK